MRILKTRAAPALFILYVFIGFVAIPGWNRGRDFSVFASWSLFTDIKPREIWYDLRAVKDGKAVFLSRDFGATKAADFQFTWRLWGLLQNLRLPEGDGSEQELHDLTMKFKSLTGGGPVELVRFKGPLLPHLQSADGIEYETAETL